MIFQERGFNSSATRGAWDEHHEVVSSQTSPARPRLEVSFWSDLARPTTGGGYEADVSWANTSTRLPVLVFLLLLGAFAV